MIMLLLYLLFRGSKGGVNDGYDAEEADYEEMLIMGMTDEKS